MSSKRFWGGFAAGALLVFFAERARRALLRGAMAGDMRLLRHAARRFSREARYGWSELAGAEQRLAHRHPGPPADDLALVDRIQSEIYRDPAIPKGAFNIEVVRGVTTLRGEMPDQASIGRVLDAVRAVDGVAEVKSLLHLPGTVAPNKAAAHE